MRLAALSMLAGIGLGAVAPAPAQRADANAVTNASDAFGFTLGTDTIGLYDSSNVRGFNPIVAGNLRMEGLYFDKQAYFTSALIDGYDIRVGASALDEPFAAPSGIVNDRMKPRGGPDSSTLTVNYGPLASWFTALDIARKSSTGDLAFAGGVARNRDQYPEASESPYWGAGGVLEWKPRKDVTLDILANRQHYWSTDSDPSLYVTNRALPPTLPRVRRLGQSWARDLGNYDNVGAMFALGEANRTRLRGLLFYSSWLSEHGYDQIFTDVAPDGTGHAFVYAYPARRFSSASGELRLEHDWGTHFVQQQTTVSVRGRSVRRHYGGEQTIDLGIESLQTPQPRPAPPLSYTAQSHDALDQAILGLQHRFSSRRMKLAVGLQRAEEKRSFQPGGNPGIRESDSQWLYSASGAYRLHSKLTVYAAYTRGLEDNGVAPASSSNRNQLLPVSISTQREVGFRFSPSERTSITAAVFQLEKPFAGQALDGSFGLVGRVRNRGIEASVSARPIAGLTVLTGAVFVDPRLTQSGLPGAGRPSGVYRGQALLYLDYALSALPLSFDLRTTYTGRTTVHPFDGLSAPSRTAVDAGLHWKGHLLGRPTALRAPVTNLTDTFAWTVDRSGGLQYIAPRTFVVATSVDF
jgi:iron complex outermembrane receptor protein